MQALINNPQIIFGDEPTGALNSKAAAEVMDILAEITGEKRIGKYSKDKADVKSRENELSSWLVQMGF